MTGPGWRIVWLMGMVALLSACRPISGSVMVDASVLTPEVTPSATAEPTVTMQPTPRLTMTTTPRPSVTPRPTAAPPTPKPTTLASFRGLSCPHPPPERPEYDRYVLSDDVWPQPDPSIPTSGFPLTDPLPYAARNAGYPYGSDGNGRYLLHNGLDMAHEADELAIAAAAGTVIVARDDLDELFGWRCDWYGQLVIIQLERTWQDQPIFLLYGHMQDIQVEEGQRVEASDPIGREAAVGAAAVAHLHFEVRVGENSFGATRNPLLWIAPYAGNGVIAGRLVDSDGRAWHGVTVTLLNSSGNDPFWNTWTYLDDPEGLVRPDPALGENFVFGPVAAGTYEIYTEVKGAVYRERVEVKAGELVTVEIVTESDQTPTPLP